MNKEIEHYCDALPSHFNEISPTRKMLLENLSNYIGVRLKDKLPVNLIYVCTHNSRRSHFGQIWAKVASAYYKIEEVNTFSGGTESTAFNANAINALKRLGFRITVSQDGQNPLYEVKYDETADPILCFSKTYDHASNPQRNFAAIMTCSEAEENCPFIPGADLRIATTYDDPKNFDNTPMQDTKYDERCRQIALETFYVFSLLNRK